MSFMKPQFVCLAMSVWIAAAFPAVAQQPSAPASPAESQCKSMVWAILQADQTLGITSAQPGSNSAITESMRKKNFSECQINDVLRKKLNLQK